MDQTDRDVEALRAKTNERQIEIDNLKIQILLNKVEQLREQLQRAECRILDLEAELAQL